MCPYGGGAGEQRVAIHSWPVWELVHQEKARHKLNLPIPTPQCDNELTQPCSGVTAPSLTPVCPSLQAFGRVPLPTP